MTLLPPTATAALSDFARRATEAAGLAAALLYALGLLRTVGELRELHLSTPTVLAGFEHSDLLMKGVGVLASHMTSLIFMLAAIVLFTSRSALAHTNHSIEHRPRLQGVAFLVVAGGTALLASRLWEGLAYTVVVVVIVGWLVIRRRPVTRLVALGVLAIGLGIIGFVGSYIHPPPPMHAAVEREDAKKAEGLLIGKGSAGDWYIATKENDTYRLEVIGGSVEKPASVVVEPADDSHYRTLASELVDHL